MIRPCITLIAALLLAACSGPPPEGVVPPAASEAALPDDQDPQGLELPPGWRLAALRITVYDAPEELLDEQDTGVITLRRRDMREPVHLVFVNGALGAHALPAGVYRVESIAGYDCGRIDLAIGPGDTPIALGSLDLAAYEEGEGAVFGNPLTPEDLDNVAGLIGEDPSVIDPRPLIGEDGITCVRDPRAVSRPDVDPNFRKLTALEIAGGLFFLALIGGATAGAAVAGGSIVFISGAAGGFLFVGI